MSCVYRTAQICKNGHVITSNTNYTAHLSNFCPECRAETITFCPNCNAPIRGQYDVPGVIGISTYIPPKYCHHCGHPFPWTESTLNSISELLDMQDQLTTYNLYIRQNHNCIFSLIPNNHILLLISPHNVHRSFHPVLLHYIWGILLFFSSYVFTIISVTVTLKDK